MSTSVSRALQLSRDEVGRALLQLPETQWFDRKSIRVGAAKLADLEIGFANADGGICVVGLSDGSVEGVDEHAAHVNALQQAAVDFTVPPVRARTSFVSCVNTRGSVDRLMVVEVDVSDGVHANVKDDVFLRVGDENRKMTFVQRQELLYDKGQASYESTPVADSCAGDLDPPLIAAYASELGHPDPSRLLVARGLATTSGRLSVAGLLLFGSEPQRQLPSAYVRVLRYRGVERGVGAAQQLLRDERCEGPVPLVLQRAQEVVREVQPSRRALAASGRFESVGLVPEDVWLEGLVNAVVHRSYSIAGDHIRVDVFDDRIEIESPGRFPGLVSLADPLHATRFARNPRIARVCSDLRYGQELGEGLRRMFGQMRLAGLADPGYRQTPASVRVTLSGVPLDRALEARLPPDSREVLKALRVAGRLGTGDLAQSMGVSRPVAVRRLDGLRELGLIVWVGKSRKDPRAYWRLPDT